MSELTATYDVKLPGRLHVTRPIEEAPSPRTFEAVVNEKRVRVVMPHRDLPMREGRGSRTWTVERLEVHVSETVDVAADMTDDDAMNLVIGPRMQSFQEIATEAVNRVLAFFRYRLRHPHLLPITLFDLDAATWTLDGQPFGPKLFLMKEEAGPQLSNPDWTLSAVREPDLLAFLAAPVEPTLPEQLLTEARTALHEENLRRAVIDGAVAVEVALRAVYFREETSAAAFEFLEDQQAVRVHRLDYLSRLPQRVWGRSFKDEHLPEYTKVDHLGRARNKATHRGRCVFRDDGGKLIEVTSPMIGGWLDAVELLLGWLDSLPSSPAP
jgi:hypothetical protein